MRIAISGSTGLIGSTLTKHFVHKGDVVTSITRRQKNPNDLTWDPAQGRIQLEKLENHDVVIHLAGTTISGRWTPSYKKLIEASRIDGTRLLCQTLTKLKHKARVLLSASAVGYYGNHAPEKICDESSVVGSGFLSEVCRQWEEETRYAREAGIHVVNLRFGVVLGKSGGALAQMLPIFKLGLGGVLGSGRQMMSWIALPEIPLIVDHLIKTESFAGPVNIVSPAPVSNREFTKILGQVIHRPVIFPVPGFGVKILFGEMGQTLLLEGVTVLPKRLQETGYVFRYPLLKPALDAVLNP